MGDFGCFRGYDAEFLAILPGIKVVTYPIFQIKHRHINPPTFVAGIGQDVLIRPVDPSLHVGQAAGAGSSELSETSSAVATAPKLSAL